MNRITLSVELASFPGIAQEHATSIGVEPRITLDSSLLGDLPEPAAGNTLEGSGDVRRDPAAVEVARLRCDAFAIHKAFVDGSGIEGDVVPQELKIRTGGGIAPRGIAQSQAADGEVEVDSVALPLAE